MARARVTQIAAQRRLEYRQHARDRRFVDGKRSGPWQQQEQRLRVQGRDVEIVRVCRGHTSHGVGIGAVLLEARGRVEALDIPRRHCPDEGLFLGVGMGVASASAFWIAAYARAACSTVIRPFT